MKHIPVLVPQVVDYLIHQDSRLILDATMGGGGHTSAILNSKADVRVVGVDRDPEALRQAEVVLERFAGRVELMNANYADLDRILVDHGKIDGALADLGLSSIQLDRPARGFSYNQDGPLDMKMSSEGMSAKMFLEDTAQSELTVILRRDGEVANAARIARQIGRATEQGAMNTTYDLKNAVDSALRGRSTPAILSKVFQAIRIAVNDELRNLKQFLDSILEHLNKNARIVVISYHSLEDRLVKNFYRQESRDCICPPGLPVCVCTHKARLEVLTRRVVKPSSREIARNPRARSARLRAARVVS